MLPRQGDDDVRKIAAQLQDKAYINDQSDAWVVLDVQGALAVSALQRLCMLDIEGLSFTDHACARTMIAHMGMMLLRYSADHFMLLAARSFAASAWHEIETSLRYVAPE